MIKINKDELFRYFNGFLKSRGIELQEGTYAQGVQKGCELLADTDNLSQEAWEQARAEMERRLNEMRQVIHERTAPKPAPAQAQGESMAGGETKRKTQRAKPRGKNTSKSKRKGSKRASR